MSPQSEPDLFELEVDGRRLQGLLDLPETLDARPGPQPAVLICHGFKGFMEWGFFPYLARLLADRGFVAVRFNFSGSGVRAGDDLVTDAAAFRDATFSKDVAEIRALLDALPDLAPGRVDPDRIGLVGHSRGGGASILAAAEEAAAASDGGQSLGALVTWAAVSTFDRLSDAETRHWRETGSLPIVNARTGQELAIGLSVLEDGERRRAALDILAAAGRIGTPWLILHGERDETVPVSEARDLASAAPPDSDLLLVEEAGHTFGAVHPFAGPTPHLTTALNATQTWLRRHLGH